MSDKPTFKSIRGLYLDAELWEQAKFRFGNVSELVNDLLKGALEQDPISDSEKTQGHLAAKLLAIKEAELAQLKRKVESMKEKSGDEKKKKESQTFTLEEYQKGFKPT